MVGPRSSRLFQLKLFNHQGVRFILVGGSATAVHALVYVVAIALWGIEPQSGNLIAYLSALAFSFVGNTYWTFSARPNVVNSGRFLLVSLTGFALNMVAVQGTATILKLSPYWALLVIVGVTPWVTYLLSSRWTYAEPVIQERQRVGWRLLLGWVVVDLLFFRHNYLSGFDQLFGDLGDPRIVLTLLEHWYHWWQGLSSWASPPFFWPVDGVLGYTDAYFLFAIPYVLLRELGVDGYLAMELSFRSMKGVGYLGMFWLLRSQLRLSPGYAIAGAVLFSILNGLYWHAIHMQLSAVALVPWVVGGVLQWIEGRSSPGRMALLGGGMAAFYLTSFYMAWYTTLAVALLLVVALWSRTLCPIRRLWQGGAAFLVTFALGIIPFLLLYLPILKEKSGHPVEAIWLNALHLPEFFRTGADNLLWGWLERIFFRVHYPAVEGDYSYIADYERIAGFTPLLGILFLLTTGWLIRRWSWGEGREVIDRRALSLAMTALILALISFRYGSWLPWEWVYTWVPGGSAMRVPSRILLFVAALLVPVALYGVQRLSMRMKRFTPLLLVLLLLEQLNFGPVHQLDRIQEETRLAFPPPPQGCESFFIDVANSPKSGYTLLDRFYTPNIDAMLLAVRWQIPTFNGVSTWLPAGWRLLDPDSTGYEDGVKGWMRRHGLRNESVCSLDMVQRRWNFPALESSPLPRLGEEGLRLQAGDEATAMLIRGWSTPERWGVWSIGEKQEVEFELLQPTTEIELLLQAYRAEERPIRLSFELIGTDVAGHWEIEHSRPGWYTVPLDQPREGPVRLQLLLDQPRSPQEWGGSDGRKLGVGLIELRRGR